MHSIHVRHAMRQNHLFYLSICFLFFAICLCGVIGIMGVHIIVAVPQLQYQLVHLVGKPVQRGLEFYQQVAGNNDGEADRGNGR